MKVNVESTGESLPTHLKMAVLGVLLHVAPVVPDALLTTASWGLMWLIETAAVRVEFTRFGERTYSDVFDR